MMRTHLIALLLAVTALSGCATVDDATSPGPVRAPGGQPGYRIAVGPDETIDSVARRFNVSREALADANRLQPPYMLQPHQVLIIPPPSSYRVQSGDTVAGIATTLGVDEIALARANGLQQPYHMRVGQVLTVPSGVGGDMPPADMAAEPGFADSPPPPPRSSISAQPLAPPPGVSGPGVGAPPAAGAYRVDPAPSGMPFGPPTPALGASLPPTPPPAASVAAAPHYLPAPAPAYTSSVPNSAPTALAPIAPRQQLAALPSGAPTPILPPKPQVLPALKQIESSGPTPHFIKPVAGDVVLGFGAGAAGQTNDGINISAPVGTPVQAAEAGTVIYTGNELAAFGNLVLIRHAGGWVTAYGHLGTMTVQRGATITKGQSIGTVGQSGAATNPQLHFEIRQGSKPVDPAPLLGG